MTEVAHRRPRAKFEADGLGDETLAIQLDQNQLVAEILISPSPPSRGISQNSPVIRPASDKPLGKSEMNMRAMLSHPFLQSNRKPKTFSSEILAHASLVTAGAGAGYRNGLAVVWSTWLLADMGPSSQSVGRWFITSTRQT